MVRYVKIAEKQRGLTFMHPVAVRFLQTRKFEKTLRNEDLHLDKEQREAVEHATGMLRALGLLDGKVDLADAFGDAYGSGTLAYYSFEDERVTVRGSKVTPSMRSTIVHELTHALQDQHFQVGGRMKALSKEATDDRARLPRSRSSMRSSRATPAG